jgi:hypothetical protein
VWSLPDDGIAGASISGNVLTVTAGEAARVRVLATIEKGLSEDPPINYTERFDFTVATCIVTFDANGGQGWVPAKVPLIALASITFPSGSGLTSASGSSYGFAGWKKNGTETVYQPGESYTPGAAEKDITFYAQWLPQYTVTYDTTDGCSVSPAETKVLLGRAYILAVPTRSGHSSGKNTFTGWWTGFGGSGTQLTGADGVSLTSWTRENNLTVYAAWTTP